MLKESNESQVSPASSVLHRTLAARLTRLQVTDLSCVFASVESGFTHKLELLTAPLPGSSSASTGSCPPLCAFPTEVLSASYKAQLRAKIGSKCQTGCQVRACDYPLWQDVAGNAVVKDTVEASMRSIKEGSSILLYGPPGVGKTLIVRALCNEACKKGFRCFWPTSADLMSKYLGESERLLRALFSLAREQHPCFLIFDEIDCLIRKRNNADSEAERKMKAEFLHQMVNLQGIVLIGTTNMPWELDIAALKRFNMKMLVPMLDVNSRRELLWQRLGESWVCSAVEMGEILELTQGYSGSDLEIACNEALLKAVKAADSAKYVKKVGEEENQCWVPCSPDDPEAVGKDEADFLASGARVGQVTAALLLSSLRNCRPTVLPSKLTLYSHFLYSLGLAAQPSTSPAQVLSYFC